jgi:hypothetical protein
MRSLHARLSDLLPRLAKVSQEVYDAWEQDENGYDDTYAYGGICDAIANEWEGIICSRLSRVDSTEVFGDGHAYLEVMYKDERCVVDLPAHVYEYGGGYNWTKIPGVTITVDDFHISRG